MTAEDQNPLQDLLEHFRNSDAKKLFENADDLRKRITKVLILVFAIFSVCFYFGSHLVTLLKEPLLAASDKGKLDLYFTGPMEVFYAYVQVSFLSAFFISAPYLFWQLTRFVKPILPDEDRGMVNPLFISSLLLFAAGFVFCYLVMLPVALKIMIEMGQEVAAPIITVGEYIGLVSLMLIGFGLAFQLPLVLIVLDRFGIVNLEILTKNRRMVAIIILVVAAIITPTPDPFSQIAMAIPMYAMYEAAIVVIRMRGKKRSQALSKRE